MAKPTHPTPLSSLALEGVTGGMADNLLGHGGGEETMVGGGNTTVVDPGTNDIVRGTIGDDKLNGGAGSDVVFANQGNDLVIIENDGSDTVYGSAGDDTAVVGWRGDGSFFDGGAGNDVLRLTFGDDALIGGAPVIDSTTPYRIDGNQMIFEGPASGSVTWNGMTIHFKDVEVIEAHGWVN
jgi:Ca2+-binding RTX toxin-like protein